MKPDSWLTAYPGAGAEVQYTDITRDLYVDVVWLDVSMDDVTGMDVVEGRDDLLDDCSYYSLIVYTATETSIGNTRHEMGGGETRGKGIRR